MARQPGKTPESGVRPAHQTRSRQQRDRLLKAGEQVFAEQGYSDSHVAQIVALADCSVGSFYRRFEDKEALFFALQGEMYERSGENIQAFFDSALCRSASLTRIAFQLINNAAREMLKIRGYYRALFEMSLAGHDVWKGMRNLERLQAAGLRRIMEARGLVVRPDFERAVSLSMRMCQGHLVSIMLHGSGPFAFAEPAGRAELCRVMMAAAGAPVDEDELRALTLPPQAQAR